MEYIHGVLKFGLVCHDWW